MAKWLYLLMYTEVVRHGVLCFLIPECIPYSRMDYSIGYGVSCKLSYIANVMVDMCLLCLNWLQYMKGFLMFAAIAIIYFENMKHTHTHISKYIFAILQ